ncbi:membrane protein [Pseudomonas phage Waldo5]|uniref:Membrane protein n=1 Tax=Pseudomonas phage Waldo5 TaxID=2762290 RepID=A0A7G8LJM6_9CAUD|nr:membrane protein [Pseudomonas phage Waldo5]
MSDFGAACLALSLVSMVLAGASLIAAMTRSWYSKWTDRWFIAFIVFACLTLVPITVGMIHDC